MKFEAHNFYHIYNQGNNKEATFYERENYLFFLSKMKKLPSQYFNIIAYCLMPNHFHMLIYTDFDREKELDKSKKYSRKIGSMLSSYAKAMNNRYDRTGSLFRQKTKAKCLSSQEQSDDQYVRTCFHYIHQNPLEAGLINKLKEWPYSSYRDYAGYRNGNLPNIKLGNKMFGFKTTKHFIEKSQMAVDPKMIEKIF